MSYTEDYGLDSFTRSRILVLLHLEDSRGEKATDILRINKEMRFFQHLTKKTQIDFSHFKLGDVSDEIRETIDDFEESGLIEQNNRGKYALTEEGEEAEKEVQRTDISPKEKDLLKFSKDTLNDLSDDELLGFMYFLLPETAEHSRVIDRINKNKEKIVKSLYEKGKISAKTAADWTGTTKREILDRFGIQIGM
jgi:predicted transcriptional regulator